MKNKELVSFIKRCISEVIVEPSTEEWAVQYHIRGKNNIPFTKHNSKSDAQTAAKKFIDSIHNSISKSEGNIIQKSENMYILIRNEGGTLGMAAWNKVTPGFVDKMNSQLDAPLKENASLVLTPTGQSDDWSRPVYKDQNGRIYVDINLGNGTPAIHSTSDEGEPEFPVRNFTISKATSSAPKKNRLCPRCGNSKPELMKKTPEGKMSCTFCHWEENPSEPYTAGTIKEAKLRCTICGGHAKGKQWWNQDKGQGICAKCARDMKARGQEDIGQSYGKEGTHYHVDESSWNNSEPTQYREYTHDGEIWYAHFNPNKHTEIPGMVILPYTRTHLPDGKKQSEFLAVHNKNDFNSLLIKWNTQQPSKWHYSPGHMNEEAQPEPYDDKTDTFQPSSKAGKVKVKGKEVNLASFVKECVMQVLMERLNKKVPSKKTNISEALTPKSIEVIKKWQTTLIDNRVVAKKLVDAVLSRRIGLTSDDLADTATFANGLDSIEEALTAGDYQGAFDIAKDTAKEMIADESGNGMDEGCDPQSQGPNPPGKPISSVEQQDASDGRE